MKIGVLSKSALSVAMAIAMSGVSVNAWATAQEEVDKQIAKLISDAISQRVTEQAEEEAAESNVWGAYSKIKVDVSTGVVASTFETDTDALVAGFDTKLNEKITLGVSASYSNTDETGYDADSWSLSPYMAYMINDTFFGIVTYTWSDNDGNAGGVNFQNTAQSLEGSMNGLYTSDDKKFSAKGRIGVRYSESEYSSNVAVTAEDSTTTRYIDLGGDYNFTDNVMAFAGVQFSDTEDDNSYTAYGRMGVEAGVTDGVYMQVKYETLIDDDAGSGIDIDVDVWTLGARMEF